MTRPIGVTLTAIALLSLSMLALYHAGLHPGRHAIRGVRMTDVVMILAGLVAAEALWSMRPHAFLAFMVWASWPWSRRARTARSARSDARRASHPGRGLHGAGIGLVAIYLRRAL